MQQVRNVIPQSGAGACYIEHDREDTFINLSALCSFA